MQRSRKQGKHPYQRFTAVSIRNKRAPGRYADGNGLYLVVDPSGAKRWIWRGIIQGKRSDLGLGSVQLVRSARRESRPRRSGARRAHGDNPRLERQREQRIVPTFKEAAHAVHAEHSPTYKNAKHRAQWLSSLEPDVFPIIGDRADRHARPRLTC